MDASEILQKLKPEHAEVIQAELDRLAKERDEANKACEQAKKEAAEAQTQSGDPEKHSEKPVEITGPDVLYYAVQSKTCMIRRDCHV